MAPRTPLEQPREAREASPLSWPRAMHRALVSTVEWTAMTGLVVMGMAVLLQVADRYILKMGYFWTEELARFLLIWCSLLAASVAVERKLHFTVTYFARKFFTGAKAAWLDFFATAVSAAALMVLIYSGYELMLNARHQTSPALQIPMSLVFMAVPANAALMLYFLIVGALRAFLEASRKELRC